MMADLIAEVVRAKIRKRPVVECAIHPLRELAAGRRSGSVEQAFVERHVPAQETAELVVEREGGRHRPAYVGEAVGERVGPGHSLATEPTLLGGAAERQ